MPFFRSFLCRATAADGNVNHGLQGVLPLSWNQKGITLNCVLEREVAWRDEATKPAEVQILVATANVQVDLNVRETVVLRAS